jgi:DNA-binding MarR family transcriptional regulator
MSRNIATEIRELRQIRTPEQQVAFLLKSLHHSLRQAVDEALRGRGIEMSFAHFATLAGLLFEPGIVGAQLAKRALVSAQTMNSILRRLEADGLIERRPHPKSRRADSWFLTDEGTQQLARARVVADSVFSRMLAALSPAEIGAFQGCLERCIAALDGPAPGLADPGGAKPRREARDPKDAARNATAR